MEALGERLDIPEVVCLNAHLVVAGVSLVSDGQDGVKIGRGQIEALHGLRPHDPGPVAGSQLAGCVFWHDGKRQEEWWLCLNWSGVIPPHHANAHYKNLQNLPDSFFIQ
jgi:hypothetical protein